MLSCLVISLYSCFVLLLASLLFITVSVCDVWVWMCMYYIARVWKPGKLCGVSCLFLPLCGFGGLNLGYQTYMASASPAEPLLLRLCLRQMSLRFPKLFIWSPFLYLPNPEIVGMFLSTRLLYPCFSEQMVFKCLNEASILLRLNVS